MQPEPQSKEDARLRRARREDIPALLHLVGGPEAGRVRALRRLTKTLVADVYVLDRASSVQGVVAVLYRRSLAHGGLVATIDTLHAWSDDAAGECARSDTAVLLACAIARARRRGCVAIDTTPPSPELGAVLEAQGFIAGARQLTLDVREAEAAPARNPS